MTSVITRQGRDDDDVARRTGHMPSRGGIDMLRRTRSLSCTAAALTLLVLAGASSAAGVGPTAAEPAQPAPTVDPVTLTAVQRQLSQITTPVQVDPSLVDADQALLEATRGLDGFAGAWLDEEGGRQVVTVATTAPTSLRLRSAGDIARAMTARATQQHIERLDVLGALAEGARVRTTSATYTFDQLKQWQATIDEHLSGLVFSDADERHNTVTIGVPPGSDSTAITARAQGLGIPDDALKIVEADFSPTLRDDHRPVAGGQQIQFVKPIFGDIGTIFSAYNCTLGVNARIVNLTTPLNGYLTNSHCSIDYAQADGTYHWQPSVPLGSIINTANRIGYEVLDPPLYTGNPYGDTSGSVNCPSGNQCRLSDAAFGAYDGDYTGTTRGYIARPSSLNDHSTWNGTSTYRITAAGAPTGAVRAVGRTSGMSTGSITQSCVRIANIDGMPGIAQNCQYIGTYSSQGGDSGGPVFRVTNSPSANDVTFVGLNWGGGTINGQAVGIVSSWPLMQVDFSPYDVRVCQAAFTC
ncbi:hypothetical protein [Cellulomonas sp. HD19AZ1]|uniref:hypothetical protein n=1 Tax=Cellulomonas sp. HD19AZ1 TaxID=2559593 RepID=UPI0010706DEE|nr:hypothetical protein [Cellulomonas sp. HD19AZ1]TFH70624.1 hypothetical protein E4A51_12770 [Cellulomonas sp. HD19AZ1]